MKAIKGFILLITLTAIGALNSQAQTSLATLDGTRVDLQAQSGKVVILAIGASWLPLSGKQADYTNSLAKRYAGKNVAVFYVTTDSTNPRSKNFATPEDMKKWAFANKIAVPVLHDPDGVRTFKKYRIEQVPSFVILDKTGAVVGDPFGGIDPKYDVTVPISKVVDRIL